MEDATVLHMSVRFAAAPSLLRSFRASGIEVIDQVLDDAAVDELAGLCDPILQSMDRRRPGARRVLLREPRIQALILASAIAEWIAFFGGESCRVVRAILFDKSPETNWMVPWHQDASIAVESRHDLPGFGPWAIKDGEHHCQPPLSVLESIVTIRLHLDACPADAGPLRVVRGSHRLGLLSEHEIAQVARAGDIVEAVTPRGGAVITTPLAVHSSAKAAATAGRRRVLHLDCSAISLPEPLRWAEAS
jgi:hypothetical protein